jgi:hypothetical protein
MILLHFFTRHWPPTCTSEQQAFEVHRSHPMNHTFDIFKRLQDGNFFWIAADRDFEAARQHLDKLSAVAPGHYLIHAQDKGFVLELNNSPSMARVA